MTSPAEVPVAPFSIRKAFMGSDATLFMKASAVLHVGALASLFIAPSEWPFALGAVIVNQLLLTAAGLWPRSRLLGPNWVRLPPSSQARGEIAITIDDGPDAVVTPQVLDLLDRYGAKATFFCIGDRAAAHSDLCRDIVRRGHAVENHSQHHSHRFAFMGLAGFEGELRASQQTFTEITGVRPLFFRAPAGLRNPLLQPVLSRFGLQLASWTRRGFDTRECDAEKVASKLLADLVAGDILLLHDGNAARAASGAPVILEVLPRLLECAAAARLRSVTLRSAIAHS